MSVQTTRLADGRRGGIRPHSSSDVLEKPFSGKTGIVDPPKVSVLLWSSVSYDFPFVCT